MELWLTLGEALKSSSNENLAAVADVGQDYLIKKNHVFEFRGTKSLLGRGGGKANKYIFSLLPTPPLCAVIFPPAGPENKNEIKEG